MTPPRRTVASERLSVRLLGPPVIERGGEAISVDTRKATAMLAYLVLTGRPRPREALTELLWPGQEPTRARGALRRTLSVLNSAIGGKGLVIDRRQVGFVARDAWVDVTEFRRLAQKDDARSLERAAELYRGELLAGFSLRDSPEFDDWQLQETEGMRRELARVLERLGTELEARGSVDGAIAQTRRWIECDPLMEEAHRRLMELYARAGDRAQALLQYRRCVAVLERELGVEPLEETTALYEAIREDRLPAASPSAPPVVVTAAPALPFVGRDAELRVLRDAYESIDEEGRLVVLGGEPGIGKTRLATEFIDAAPGGAAVLVARCHAGEELLPFGTVIELLRAAGERIGSAPPAGLAEAARLVPELVPGATPLVSLDSPAARRRLFDGVCEVLTAACAGERPGIVLIDDIHSSDESSRDLVGFLVRRLVDRPLLVIVTWRTEEVPPVHPLRRMLTDAQRAGVGIGITLGRLQPPDVDALVRATGIGPGEVSDTLYAESAGVPFFLSEYLAALRSGGEGSLPSGVRDLLASRVANASRTAVQVLTAAAVLGRTFDADALRATSGRSPEEVATAVEELLALGLVVEVDGAYDVGHPKLRTYVYESATHARRRLLHARAADAFVRTARRRPQAAAPAAHHLERAGREAEAAEQFAAAGEHARGVFANAEALAHHRSAIALGHPDAASLHEAVGELLTLQGRYRDAVAAFETAAALGADAGEVERKLGGVHHRLGDWDAADAHFAEALDQADGSAHRARVLADRSLNAHRAGRAEDASALAAQALAAAVDADDLRALAQAHNIAGIVAAHAGQRDEAARHLASSLELAERSGDPAATAAALNNLSLVLGASGELERALGAAERALELTSRVGDRHREAALHSNYADLLRAAGRAQEAQAHVTTSAKIFAEVGHEGELHPEIWKLVEW